VSKQNIRRRAQNKSINLTSPAITRLVENNSD